MLRGVRQDRGQATSVEIGNTGPYAGHDSEYKAGAASFQTQPPDKSKHDPADFRPFRNSIPGLKCQEEEERGHRHHRNQDADQNSVNPIVDNPELKTSPV